MTLNSQALFHPERSAARGGVQGMLAAWLHELARLVSARAASLPKRHVMVLGPGPAPQIFVRRGRTTRAVADAPARLAEPADWKALQATLKRNGLNRLPLVIRLTASQTLERNLQLPAAVAGVVEPVLRHQVQRLTPWPESETAFAYAIAKSKRGATGIAVTMLAAHKPTLEANRLAAEAAGLKVAIVDGAEDPSTPPCYVLFDAMAGSRSAKARTIGLVLGLILTAATACGAVGVWHYMEAQRQAQTLSQEIASIESRLAARRRIATTTTIAERAARMVLRRRTEESSKLETLGLLTRLLPDSAYLTDLTIDRDKAVLTGFARDTAHIVAALEGTAKLQDVRLTGTTTRDGPDHREAFQISARMHTPQQAGDQR